MDVKATMRSPVKSAMVRSFRKHKVADARSDQALGASKVLTWLCLMLAAPSIVNAQETVVRLPGESIEAFAKRIIPGKTELAHKVLEGGFGPSDRNIVILFHPTEDVDSNYTGWIMVPDASSGSYKKFTLPEMAEIKGHFEITVTSVLYANADKDKDLELIVLYNYYRNGSGEKEDHAAYVYDWNGKEFVVLQEVSDKLVGLKSAAEVRRKLKALGY